MTRSVERPRLPFARPNLLEIAPLYQVLRREAPIAPVTTPAGDPAWLVTRFGEVRDLLGDRRFGRSHPEPEKASRLSTASILDGPTGDYATEAADHARMRRLLTPAFSAKRMRLLAGHVQRLVDDAVDRMIAEHDADPDGTVDLHARLALSLPVAVICELLGVPESDGEYFRALSDRMATFSGQDAYDALVEFGRYMVGLVEAKRSAPTEDVISDLMLAQAQDESFGYPEMIQLCVGLLFAGHETTVNSIGIGALFLLTRPEQWAALTADPDGRVAATVEEIMRMTALGELGLLRYAHEDVEIGGVRIERGDALVLSISAANRDADVFADAETFDPDRAERGHVGFGHGAHFCIGASLARTELRAVFATLARRLPDLALGVDLDEIDVRTDHLTGGVRSLPVRW